MNVKLEIKQKIEELARALGRDASSLKDDQLIPDSGLLDSASLMVLIVWYETNFGVSTDDVELTIDNFGTIDLMAQFLDQHR
jgi:D-alanine--poly(phosphoribitol) ligase subunit 2